MKGTRTSQKQYTLHRFQQAASELISKQGVEKTGISAVARQANLDKTLIYRYYGGLPGLLDALFVHQLTRLLPTQADQLLRQEDYVLAFYDQLQRDPAFLILMRWQFEQAHTDLGSRLAGRLEDAIRHLTGDDSVKRQLLYLLLGGLVVAAGSQRPPTYQVQLIPDLIRHLLGS